MICPHCKASITDSLDERITNLEEWMEDFSSQLRREVVALRGEMMHLKTQFSDILEGREQDSADSGFSKAGPGKRER